MICGKSYSFRIRLREEYAFAKTFESVFDEDTFFNSCLLLIATRPNLQEKQRTDTRQRASESEARQVGSGITNRLVGLGCLLQGHTHDGCRSQAGKRPFSRLTNNASNAGRKSKCFPKFAVIVISLRCFKFTLKTQLAAVQGDPSG